MMGGGRGGANLSRPVLLSNNSLLQIFLLQLQQQAHVGVVVVVACLPAGGGAFLGAAHVPLVPRPIFAPGLGGQALS